MQRVLREEKLKEVVKLQNENSIVAKPFLKWVGGKSQLLSKFQELYPDDLRTGKIKNYYEPFVGGGAVFFDIMQKYTIQSAHLYDINEELVLAYMVIRRDVDNLIEILYKIEKQYKKLNKEKQKQFFYELRSNYNQQRHSINYKKYSKDWIGRAAQIIFLNKTCYNGLFRFNLKGEFNTPLGSYSNPKILDEVNLMKVSGLLSVATIINTSFSEVLNDIREDSFVYFDPPYRPISSTSSFTAYSKFRFGDEEQLALADVYTKLDKLGVKIMLSNSDPKNTDASDVFFDKIYANYNIKRVPARRMINSDATKRNKINEIVVTNY